MKTCFQDIFKKSRSQTEFINTICSFESELSFDSICSVGILDIFKVIVKNFYKNEKFLTLYIAVFTNWYKNEPDNNHGVEHYVTMHGDGTWNDFRSSKEVFIICQELCDDKKDSLSSSG